MGEYEKAFAQLNAQQRKAVKQIDGPVLVVAGPGTGKTQLLSTRVAHILKTTDTRASNILCLTFTNKAAVNMKQRIIDIAGAAGSRVAASTFHSFAAEIMNLYPDDFWNAADLSVAPDSVQLDVVESIIGSLPLDNPLALKFAGQHTLIKDVQQSINLAKEAGLTPDKLRAIIKFNQAYIDVIENQLVDIFGQRLSAKNLTGFASKINQLPQQAIDQSLYPLVSLSTVIIDSLTEVVNKDSQTNKCTYTSRWKSRWLQSVGGRKGMFKERDRNEWWLQLADVYESYREGLHQRGYYDYADMLVEVVSQLEQNPKMLADVQERFNYVLIDEFQDTTAAQLRLAYLIAEHFTTEGRPNIMVVGDDDQSIFKFSGAELNNMLGFRRIYPATKTIILTDNYRSTQAILNISKKIIDQAESRLVDSDPSLNKDLKAVEPPPDGQISATSYASRELQLSDIAHRIKKDHRPDKSTAVLARGHDSLIKLAGLLQQLGVPVRYEQASNILNHEIVNQTFLIVKLLQAINDGDRPAVNSLIHKIVRWPVWGLDGIKLWGLASERGDQDWLSRLLESPSGEFKALGNWFVWLAQQTASQPLAVTIEQVIGLRESHNFTSPIRDYYVGSSQHDLNSYFRGLSAIQLLRALVHEFSASGEPTLTDLTRFIEINKQNGIVIADESPFITGRQAVQLLTVHKAKGLEFDEVYVVDAIEDNWQPRSGGRKPPANLPLQPVGDDIDDYVRLMYVAATRARSSLIISAYHQDHSGKAVATSRIVSAAMAVKQIGEEKIANLIRVLEENLHWPSLNGGLEKEMLKGRLETYDLAVTHLLNFLDLTKGGPQYFKERNLLLLPEVKTASLSYGTAMHAALEKAQRLTNRGAFSLTEVKNSFAEALEAEQLPPTEYERYLPRGQQNLTQLFKKLGYSLPQGSISEQRLRAITIGRARIGGKLDRVDTGADEIIVIDYKTGAPLNSLTTKDKSTALKAYKHRLQLIFYALLISQTRQLTGQKIIGQMVYLQAETDRQLIRDYTPSPQEIDRLRHLIEAVWLRIITLNLPDVSGYSQDLPGILQFEQDLIDGK